MKTVLIVDDHAGFRGMARRLLEDAGFVVVGEAEDGATALRAYSNLRPDAVLMDVQLPDASGLSLTRTLADGIDPPAIVLISSRDAADYGGAITRSGARGFIGKADLTAQGFAALVRDPT